VTESETPLKTTPLDGLHRALGARMVPFAGYAMPVQYKDGILAEHLHTRAACGLFDVSHMGRIELFGEERARALETLVPGDILSLALGRQRYTQFTAESGGIRDDLMVANLGDRLSLVVNAGCKDEDLAHLRAGLPKSVRIEPLFERALLALQGPKAAAVMARFAPAAGGLPFMGAAEMTVLDAPAVVSRSGYTGEDGFEISLPAAIAADFAQRLLREPEVKPIGLGARDSLRLEAGLCLYGHDIDLTTTPIEAGLAWSIAKRRREAGGFPGDAVVRRQLAEGASRRLVGIKPDGRAPAREGTEIRAPGGAVLGRVTSGGFGPTVNGPIAMGYVAAASAKPGTALELMVRGKALPAAVVALPFVPKRYAA